MKELSEAAKASERIRIEMPAGSASFANRKMIYGVGLNDADYVVGRGEHECPAYAAWMHILERCYSKNHHAKHPAYIGCSVSAEWLSFMRFREWFISNHVDGYAVDKDLILFGNRVYGPDYCVFVSRNINNFMTDRRSCRGDLPIGVCLTRQGTFQANCRDGGRKIHLGVFGDKWAAHLAWQKFKLNRLEDLRAEMDAIDWRIYNVAKAKILSYEQRGNPQVEAALGW